MSGIFGTVLVLVILLAVVGLIVYSMIKDKKSGKSSCGCNCGCCPNSASCHGAEAKSKNGANRSKGA
jgi:uncharacterized protein (UPF0333 family)